jgi:hypothetical protein
MKALIWLIFMALCLWATYAMSNHGEGRISIIVDHGRRFDIYRTDAYRQKNGCVHFLCDGDSVELCGSYRIKARK